MKKKIISVVVVVSMLLSIVPASILFASAATTPGTVTVDEATKRINTLIQKFNADGDSGLFFTVDGKPCASGDHKVTDCENCKVQNIAQASWLKDLIGMGDLNSECFPATYLENGNKDTYLGYGDFGFANFAHWFIFAQKNTDNMVSSLVTTGKLDKGTLLNARPGDVIRTNWNSGHSMIFISCENSCFKVLDCNFRTPDDKGACQVKVHYVPYNNNYSVGITGVTNYNREINRGSSGGGSTGVKKGMDLSRYQGNVNFNTIKSRGVDFVILRCYCNGKDSKFDEYYNSAKAAGLDVGAYTFMYAMSSGAATNEANAAISALGGKKLDYPLWLDVEDNSLGSLGRETVTSLMITELQIIEGAGYQTGYYTFTSFRNSYINTSRLTNYDLWIAAWPGGSSYDAVSPSSCSYNCAMWQFTDSGSGSYFGVGSATVDLDYCYKDYSNRTYKGYEIDDRNFMIHDCETTDGWSGDFNTSRDLSMSHTQGDSSLTMENTVDQAQMIGSSPIGALVRGTYSEAMNLSKYQYIAFDYMLNYSNKGYDGYLEFNFCTDNAEDGYDLRVDITDETAGWHTKVVKISDIPKVADADWSKINRLRWSWWNTCQRRDVRQRILLDNVRASMDEITVPEKREVPDAVPSGNILKVTYSNENSDTPGYKFLDKSDVVFQSGYKLCYDVYLNDKSAGIGGIDLDNDFSSCARDDTDFVDQNNLPGHPKTDITDYAYQKWYHRELTLCPGWDNQYFTGYSTLIAFDGWFAGNATAYFDNIKIVDADGNDVEYFFQDGGKEYSYQNTPGSSYQGLNYSGLDASVVALKDVFPELDTKFECNVLLKLNGAQWNDCDKQIHLEKNGQKFYPTTTGYSQKFKVDSGVYSIFDGSTDCKKTVEVTGNTSVTLDFVKIDTKTDAPQGVSINCVDKDNNPISEGSAIMSGMKVTLTASDSFTGGKSFFTWSTGAEGKTISLVASGSLPKITNVERLLWGDVTGDNSVDASDSLLVLRASINAVKIIGHYAEVADVATDKGVIDSVSALLILRRSIKAIKKFPVEQ